MVLGIWLREKKKHDLWVEATRDIGIGISMPVYNWGKANGGKAKTGLFKLIVIDILVLDIRGVFYLLLIIVALFIVLPKLPTFFKPSTNISKLLVGIMFIFIILEVLPKSSIEISKLLAVTASISVILEHPNSWQ